MSATNTSARARVGPGNPTEGNLGVGQPTTGPSAPAPSGSGSEPDPEASPAVPPSTSRPAPEARSAGGNSRARQEFSPAGRPCVDTSTHDTSFTGPDGVTHVVGVMLRPYPGSQGRAIQAMVSYRGEPLCQVDMSLGASKLITKRDLGNSGFMRGVFRCALALAHHELEQLDAFVSDAAEVRE